MCECSYLTTRRSQPSGPIYKIFVNFPQADRNRQLLLHMAPKMAHSNKGIGAKCTPLHGIFICWRTVSRISPLPCLEFLMLRTSRPGDDPRLIAFVAAVFLDDPS